MFDISAIQIVIVLVIALLVFGPKRMPELGRQLGKGLRELKGHMNSVADGVTNMGGDAPETATRDATPPRAATEHSVEPEPEPEDDLLDGVVVKGSTPPAPPRHGD